MNLIGKTFGSLTVAARSEHGRWECRCVCGNTVFSFTGNLLKLKKDTCICEFRKKRIRERTTHGMTKTPEHRAWSQMWTRCTNPNHKSYIGYGDSGVTVDPSWKKFETFFADMGPRPSPKHSVDRIDFKGPYSKANCRWADRIEQANNKSNNLVIEFNGRSQTLSQWARELGVKVDTLGMRFLRGWSAERALTEPFRKSPRKP